MTVPVRWWHGDDDHIVPFRHGQHVVDRLPDATMTVIDGESHLGGLGIAGAGDPHADGPRPAPRRAARGRRGPESRRITGFQAPHGSQWVHNYIAVTHAPFHLRESAGEGVTHAGDEGGHGDRTHCYPPGRLWDEGNPLRPLSAVRTVPAHRVGRRRCPRRCREPGLDAAAGPVRQLPRRAVVDRQGRFRGRRSPPPCAAGTTSGSRSPRSPRRPRRARATPTRPSSASSTPSPASTATS